MHYTVADMVLDAFQNSVEAASRIVIVDYHEDEKDIDVYIADNGKGMDEAQLKKAADPFQTDGKKHSGRKVGLGLPFIRQAAEQAEGKFSIDSRPGEGTSLFFSFRKTHVDCPPAGNAAALFTDCFLFSGAGAAGGESVAGCREGELETVINRRYCGNRYSLVKSELAEALGELNDAGAITLLRKYIEGLEESVKEGPRGKTDA